MISTESFSKEWIEGVAQQYGYHDKELLEKIIRAFALLETLVDAGAPLTFKGGSSILLLLKDNLNRLVPTPKSRHGNMSNQLRQKIMVFVQSQVQSIIRRVRTAPFATPQNGEPRLRLSSSDIAPVSVRTGPTTNPVTV